MLANALYYNPVLTLNTLTRTGQLTKVLAHWMTMLSKRGKSGKRRHHRREHDKKAGRGEGDGCRSRYLSCPPPPKLFLFFSVVGVLFSSSQNSYQTTHSYPKKATLATDTRFFAPGSVGRSIEYRL